MTAARRASIVRVLWVACAWVVLWRDLSWANVIGGAAVGFAVVAVFPPPPSRWIHRLDPIGVARFVVHNLVAIVRANLVVAWEVVSPHNRIREAVVVYPMTCADPDVVLMVSHSIGLAPGTVVLDVVDADGIRPPLLHIHVLHFVSVEATRAEVAELERLAFAALGSRECPP